MAKEDMEVRIAHLERTVEELSDVIARQDRELLSLKARVAKLVERDAERDRDGSGGVVLGDERPPHY
ncbi:MAG: SlyX family protein [Pseudomonadota bacterium]